MQFIHTKAAKTKRYAIKAASDISQPSLGIELSCTIRIKFANYKQQWLTFQVHDSMVITNAE